MTTKSSVSKEPIREVKELVTISTQYGSYTLPKDLVDAGFKSEHITKTDLIKERGWTNKLVETHLGVADKIVKNKHKRGAKCQLYSVRKVLDSEHGAAVREELNKIARSRHVRSAAGKNAALARNERALEERARSIKEMNEYVQTNKAFFRDRLAEIAKTRKPGMPVGKRTLKNDDRIAVAVFDICKDFGFDIAKDIEIAVNAICNEVVSEFIKPISSA
jgi:hypothetical protein